MPGTGIFRGLAQIINGGEKIIFDNRFTDTKRMRDLAGGFNIKLRLPQQLAPMLKPLMNGSLLPRNWRR
ncbi:hypothetical protein AWZ82_19470 [Shigella sonnei]|nr:hypothetical protein AWZ82_19470 [Shigella sonnei]